MTPETKARQQIDQNLEQAGWFIQDMIQLNLGAAMGVAVREYPTDTGPADDVLFVNRNAVGFIEAKKDSAGENLTVTENQTERYDNATLKWRKDNTPLRFLYGATGQIIRFSRDDDTVLSLANRLVRLAKQLDDEAQARIEKISGGIPVGELGKGLIAALGQDAVAQTALATAKAKGITRSEDTLLPVEIEAARAERVAAACAPFEKPELREEIESCRREREQLIDHINLDQITFAGFQSRPKRRPRR